MFARRPTWFGRKEAGKDAVEEEAENGDASDEETVSGRLIEEEDRATGKQRPLLWGASTARKSCVTPCSAVHACLSD